MGKKTIAHYPSSRRLSSEEKKEIVEVFSLRPNHKHHSQSQAMIRKNCGKLVTLNVYIQNLKGSVRELTHKGLKDTQLILDHLQEALQEDNSACGGVVVDEAHTLEVLYFQMGHMRNLYEKFSDILLVGGIYPSHVVSHSTTLNLKVTSSRSTVCVVLR